MFVCVACYGDCKISTRVLQAKFRDTYMSDSVSGILNCRYSYATVIPIACARPKRNHGVDLTVTEGTVTKYLKLPC